MRERGATSQVASNVAAGEGPGADQPNGSDCGFQEEMKGWPSGFLAKRVANYA